MEKLLQIREFYKLTQDEIAKHCEVSQSHWTNLEKGTSQPSTKLLKRICTIFGVNPDWLSGESENMINAEPTFKPMLNVMGMFESLKNEIANDKNSQQSGVGIEISQVFELLKNEINIKNSQINRMNDQVDMVLQILKSMQK